jgi:hypothetical protein
MVSNDTPDDKLDEIPFEVPRIGIRIRRMGDQIQFNIGGMQLKVKEMGNFEYDLVTIEQFLTMASKKAYENLIRNEQIKKDLMSLAEDNG